MEKEIRISIVILTYNGEEHLEEVLKGIFNQKIDLTFEVIAIDSGSSDRTIEILNKFLVRIKKIEKKDFGHGKTRQLGAELSKGEFVVFLTQDATPVDDFWLENLIDNFRDSEVAGVCSRILPRENACLLKKIEVNNDLSGRKERIIAQIENREKFDDLTFHEKRLDYYFFNDVSSAIRKDFLIKNNFPDVEFAEDVEFAKMALKKGRKIIFEPRSIVYHSHDYTIKKTYQRNYVDSKYHKMHFSIENVPTLKLVVLNTFKMILRDLKELGNYNVGIREKIKSIFYSPVIHLAEQLGQYKGTKN